MESILCQVFPPHFICPHVGGGLREAVGLGGRGQYSLFDVDDSKYNSQVHLKTCKISENKEQFGESDF